MQKQFTYQEDKKSNDTWYKDWSYRPIGLLGNEQANYSGQGNISFMTAKPMAPKKVQVR